MKLSGDQKKYREIFLNKVDKKLYKEVKVHCPCGAKADVTLFSQDKFEIPLKVVLCKNCGLVRCDPYYSEDTLRSFYDLEYRGLYEDESFDLKDLYNKQYRSGKQFSNYLKKHYFKGEVVDKVIYEIGCSTGGVLGYFKEKGNRVVGCDYDTKQVGFGVKKGLTLFCGDFKSLFNAGGKADVIILSHVLEHIPNPVVVLRKVRKLLKKGGVLFIAVPGIYSIHRSYQGNLEWYIQNAHAFYFTKNSLKFLLSLSGYKTIYADESVFGIFKIGKSLDSKTKENYKNVIRYLNATKVFGKVFYFTFILYIKIQKLLKKIGILELILRSYHRLQKTSRVLMPDKKQSKKVG